ncbi:hypothetical protein N7468_010658 [Penicillium chermesinum]|uniref:Uncharacterized protein n=1 Tax=Penicillium chermesinum TaxID=63820 RepID=A0A9W9N823_9EURO|nr:uncharacterized protein N7468_010658 [Penicillium chermesinum]KAJ5214979.1 hypothetical protein N7468_010658 [Penicillium chermesinum]
MIFLESAIHAGIQKRVLEMTEARSTKKLDNGLSLNERLARDRSLIDLSKLKQIGGGCGIAVLGYSSRVVKSHRESRTDCQG